ncbi:unnamed protein product, partial [Nesidiocoris tenuis]
MTLNKPQIFCFLFLIYCWANQTNAWAPAGGPVERHLGCPAGPLRKRVKERAALGQIKTPRLDPPTDGSNRRFDCRMYRASCGRPSRLWTAE